MAALHAVTEVTPNAATAQLGGMDMATRAVFFAKTLPQLFGEELLTKNLWVSTGAHILNDWVLFAMGILGASMAGKA